MLLAAVATKHSESYQRDVKPAFLNEDPVVQLFTTQAEGYIDDGKATYVRKANKVLYGLK